jgi:hypothetical protein
MTSLYEINILPFGKARRLQILQFAKFEDIPVNNTGFFNIKRDKDLRYLIKHGRLVQYNIYPYTTKFKQSYLKLVTHENS